MKKNFNSLLATAFVFIALLTFNSCTPDNKSLPKPPGGGEPDPKPVVKTPNFTVTVPPTFWFAGSGNVTATIVADVDSIWSNRPYTFSNGVLIVQTENLQQPELEIKIYAKNSTGGYLEKSVVVYAFSPPRTGLCQTGRFTMSSYTTQIVDSTQVFPAPLNKDTLRFKTNDSVYVSLYNGTGFEYRAKYSLANEWTSNVHLIAGDDWIMDWINESGFKRHMQKPALNPPYLMVIHTQEFIRVSN